MKTATLTCPKCGAETNPEYRIDKLGDRHPVWQCLNIDCLHLDY